MAKQKGSIRLNGSLGALSFYRDKRYGDLVREKGGPSKKQIETLPSCEIVRQNNSEFGTASRASKLFRESFYPLIHHCRDSRLHERVQKKMMEILKLDERHKGGQRLFLRENFSGFGTLALHSHSKTGDCFRFPLQRRIEQDCMQVEAVVNAARSGVPATSHYKVISVAAHIDFTKGKQNLHTGQSHFLRVEEEGLVSFAHVLKGKGFLFHGLCIVFYQQVNETFYLLKGEGFNNGFVEYAG